MSPQTKIQIVIVGGFILLHIIVALYAWKGQKS